MKEVYYENTDADAFIEYYTINDTILFYGELNYNVSAQPLIYRTLQPEPSFTIRI
ncbi:MAG: hypothetical protein IPF75_17030 [Bacteroidetes bacterium]|nr:hypothetical protein [Bacteroidota bacterium]